VVGWTDPEGSRLTSVLCCSATGTIDLVIDWKTDVNPTAQQIELYRGQLRDYLIATGSLEGILVFVTTGQIVRVNPASRLTVNAA
jgi:hypothetical protein